MRQGSRSSKGAVILSGLLLGLLLSPAANAAPLPPAAAASADGLDLAPALAADGTFVGAPAMIAPVDTSAWTLVSDLAAGEPPRFAPAGEPPSAVDAGSWSALGSNGAGNGAIAGPFGVYALAVWGSNLYVGGVLNNVAGIPAADGIARWNGSSWSALGPGLNGIVYSIVPSGANLFVGGGFTDAAGIATADYLARWNGNAWFALGSNGTGNGALNGPVMSLARSSSNLYAGGFFFNAAGVPEADYVARWSGGEWLALGSNSAGNGALGSGSVVRAIALLGSDVFVGGDFQNAASITTADYIAKFNGSAWFALGTDGSDGGALNHRVYSLAVSGFDVFVGGQFTDAAGIPEADYIARWTSPAWHAVGPNGPGEGALNDVVFAVAISGPDLYVGGQFTDVGGEVRADNVARWSGGEWYALGSSGTGDGAINGRVWALVPGSLFAGGEFTDAAGKPKADYVAKWTPPTPDGRIRKGTGAYVGNNIYNSTGLNQSKSGKAVRGSTITFGISIQNDAAISDGFTVHATGTPTTAYTVRYFRGTTEITSAVNAGTYQTPSLAAGARFLITARVKVGSAATVGSSVTRLMTVRSLADPARLDAVKLTGKRG